METKTAQEQRNLPHPDELDNFSTEEVKEMTFDLLEQTLKRQAECRCENCNDDTREMFADLLFLVHISRNFKSVVTQQLAVNFATLAVGDIRKFFAMMKTAQEVMKLTVEGLL